MGFFKNLFAGGGSLQDALNQFSGNTKFLNAMCGACALAAAAEGGIDGEEEEKALQVMGDKFGSAFAPSEIERSFLERAKKTKTRSGKQEIKDEIAAVARTDSKGEAGKAIILAMADVADSDGIGDAEKAAIEEVCGICKQDYKKLVG